MTNAPKPPTALDRLREERERINHEVEKAVAAHAAAERQLHIASAQLYTIDMALSLISEQPAAAPAPKAARGEVEKAVRDEMKATDISYSTEELSESIGHNRESVAAVLRRLVKSGEVEREGERYRIARLVQQDAAEWAALRARAPAPGERE